MQPLNIENSLKSIVVAIEDFQKGTVANSNEITKKIDEFIKANPISESTQKQITALLGRLSDQSGKAAACTELAALITTVVTAIQQPDKKESAAEQENRLREARTFLVFIKTQPEQIDKFVSMTNEKERLDIIKNEIKEEFCLQHRDDGRGGWAKERVTDLMTSLTQNFERYKLPDASRFEIVKTLAEHDCLISYCVSDCPVKSYWMERAINAFKFPEQQRRELAKIAVTKVNWDVNKDIGYYRLNEQNRAEIAKIAASQETYFAESSLPTYDIKDENLLFEIAKVAAKHFPEETIKRLADYKVTKPKDRKDIFTIAIENGKRLNDIQRYVHSFVEDERLFIATIMAAKYEGFYFPAYNITKETDRITLAKIYAKHFGFPLHFSLPSLNIIDTRALLDICFLNAQRMTDTFPEKIFEAFRIAFGFSKQVNSESYSVLEREADELSAGEDEQVKWRLYYWLTDYNWACDMAQIPENVRKEQLQYPSQILKYEDPQMRYALLSVLFQYGLPKKAEGKDHILLFDMLLTPLLKDSGLTAEDVTQIWSVLKHNDYYDSTKREKVVKGLLSLLRCEDLSTKDKGILLKHIFRKKIDQPILKEKSAAGIAQQKSGTEKTAAYTELQMLDALIISKHVAVLKKAAQSDKKETDEKDKKAALEESSLKQPIDLDAAVYQVFKECLGLEAIPEFTQKYTTTIGAGRNPLALLVYAAQLGSLSAEEFEKATKSLKEFTTEVLNGEKAYKAWRYKSSPGSHLDVIFKGREHVKAKWMEGEKLTLGELNKKIQEEDLKVKAVTKSAYSEFDPVQYLKDRILGDKHTAPEKFTLLENCLNDPKKCNEALKSLSQERKKDKLSKTEKYDPNNATTKPMFLRQLETALINLLVSSRPSSQKVADIDEHVLPQLTAIYGANSEIVKDIQALQKHLQAGAQSDTKANIEKKYIIEDTDNWEDMLLSGTEVIGSCQRISGSSENNKCLLAYLADGKNRAIVVKDAKSGQIVARRIMRLLVDGNSGQPVIFQERLYRNPGVPAEALQAIDFMFARRANQLGLPLVRTAEPNESTIPVDLKSLGSPAPFEYVDAGGLGVTQGRFTITSNHIFRVQ